MTLEQLAAAHGTSVNIHVDTLGRVSKYIVFGATPVSEAFHLTDYIVSSCAGVVYWFMPKS